MICSKCGKRILTNAKYCTNCGTKLEYPESKQTVSRGPIPITGPAKKGKGILLGVLGVVIGCAAAVFLILLLIGLAGTDGSVNIYDIADNVTQGCANSGYSVDSVDVEFRGSFPYENDCTLEVYDITVDVLGEGKGKVLFSYIVGKNAAKLEKYYPASLLAEVFMGGLMPDFDTESFSDEDIAAFVDHGYWFDPNAQ